MKMLTFHCKYAIKWYFLAPNCPDWGLQCRVQDENLRETTPAGVSRDASRYRSMEVLRSAPR